MRDERHPLDPVSLIFGLVFVVLAIAGLTNLLVRTDLAVVRWLVPAALIVLGVALLVGGLRRAGAAAQAPAPDQGGAASAAERPADHAEPGAEVGARAEEPGAQAEEPGDHGTGDEPGDADAPHSR